MREIRIQRGGARLAVSAAMALLLVVTGAAFSFVSYLRDTVAQLEAEDLELFDKAWRIRYLDEALTHSTAQYVLSQGDQQWKDRYNSLVIELDETIASLRETKHSTALEPLDKVSQANDRLISLEMAAFEATEQGDFERATALLEGDYEQQKAVYRNGLQKFFDSERQNLNTRLQRATRRADILRIATIFPGLVLAAAVLIVARSYRRQSLVIAQRDAERNRVLHLQVTEQQIAQALEIAQTETDVLAAVTEVFRAEHSGPAEVLLSDSSRTHLRQVLSTDPSKQLPGCAVPSPHQCPAVRRGSTLNFDDANSYASCPHLRTRNLPDGTSASCIPINVLGLPLGVVHALKDQTTAPEIDADNKRLLDRIATQLGDRIGVMRTISQSRLQADTDPLTGLSNRRSVEAAVAQLSHEVDSYAVVFFDLDFFKAINDRHGHETGDRALRVFSKVLRDSMRQNDLAARWGGEEFLLVLPSADLTTAVNVYERVRESLAITLASGPVPTFTASAGVARLSGNEDFLAVVTRADTALLKAKSEGRNRVISVESDEPRTSLETPLANGMEPHHTLI